MSNSREGRSAGSAKMNNANGVIERLRELTAKIATEHDHGKFTALVEEFNQLLDGEQPAQLPRNGEDG